MHSAIVIFQISSTIHPTFSTQASNRILGVTTATSINLSCISILPIWLHRYFLKIDRYRIHLFHFFAFNDEKIPNFRNYKYIHITTDMTLQINRFSLIISCYSSLDPICCAETLCPSCICFSKVVLASFQALASISQKQFVKN